MREANLRNPLSAPQRLTSRALGAPFGLEFRCWPQRRASCFAAAKLALRGRSGHPAVGFSPFSSCHALSARISPAQHHPFYDEEKVAYEADPANAVLLRLKKDGDDGFLGLVKDIIRDAPTPPRREQPFGMELPGQPADDWMRRLATICIEGKGGLFTMAPPCGHRESVEMFFRLFQPFLWSGGNVVLYFVTGRMHPGTLDVVVDWQRCVKAEASGSLDFCFFDQETGLSTGDAGFQIITKTGYLATGFYTPGGWCTKFWSNDEPPKNMTWGNFVLSLWPLKEGEEGRPANESMLKQTERSLQYWTGGVLYSTPSVRQYVRGKERAARC